MESIKGNRSAVPHLPPTSERIQEWLNRRSMWKRSFRGVPIMNSKMFGQKVNYIHMNPVRAGLCERPEDYRWSSCWMYTEGKFDRDRGVLIDDDLIRFYCDPK